MHSAPSLAEAPTRETPHPSQQPTGDAPTPNHQLNGTQENHVAQGDGSAPVRKDTTSSTSTSATAASLATLASSDSTATGYTVEQSPTVATQGVFPVREGIDVATQRKASRRRTGPLSAEQRKRAAMIRKLGACADCRRRRVACHPNHHGMTWEELEKKFMHHSPSHHDLTRTRPISPAPLNPRPVFTQDPQEMEIDVLPTQQQQQQQPGRQALMDAHAAQSRIRTPLPSGPRPDKPPSIPNPAMMHVIDAAKASDLQATATRILSNSFRSRYNVVSALLLHWQDDDDRRAMDAMQELGAALQQHYHYTYQIKAIPSSSETKGEKWLSREVTNFIDAQDDRDVLKIFYYSGHSCLDRHNGNREMVLSSPKDPESPLAIRWSGIQQIFENASADTLIIMDAAYYPSSMPIKHEGMLELMAASASGDHLGLLDRGAFTRALTDQLKRATQRFMNALSAAELHAKLLSQYPTMIRDRSPEKEMVMSFPSPLFMQLSRSSRLPSILLAPLQRSPLPISPDSPSGGVQMTLTFRCKEEAFSADKWAECFRLMPEGIREVKVEGARNTFR